MAETTLENQLTEARDHVLQTCDIKPQIGLVLGSGLGAFADSVAERTALPYGEIPHMPAPTVSGHAGKMCLGRSGDIPVACLQGRVHLYEGHPAERLVFGVRLLAHLGCSIVLLTNAAGGIDAAFKPGTLMLIDDHLNLSGTNPLNGPNHDFLGPRFPDMTRAYDEELCAMAKRAAADIGLDLAQGIYAALQGPSYETPAEIRMLRTLGANAVGMSTVPEVIALRHIGVRCGAISCITNMAAGLGHATLDHSEVEETAGATRDVFMKLLASWIQHIAA